MRKLINEKMNKLDLQKVINITPYTIAKMEWDDIVGMEILDRILIDINEIYSIFSNI